MPQGTIALVTGAGGEMGHLLLPALAERGTTIVAVDLQPLPPSLASRCAETVQASITDAARMGELLAQHRPQVVYHLAALLSRQAEQDPEIVRVLVEASAMVSSLPPGVNLIAPPPNGLKSSLSFVPAPDGDRRRVRCCINIILADAPERPRDI